MRGFWWLARVSLLAIMAMARSAQAAEPVAILQPSSNWFVDYKDGSCALQRTFGDPQHQVVLELDDYTLRDEFRATVATAAFGASRNQFVAGFQPGAPSAANEVTQATFAQGRQGVIFNLAFDEGNQLAFDEGNQLAASMTEAESGAARSARQKAVTGLFVGGAFDTDLMLQTGPMAAPMDVMHKCVDDLERKLGINAQATHQWAKPIKGTLWTRKIQDINPTEVVSPGHQAKIYFPLVINSSGRVGDCYARLEGEPRVLAESACAILKSDARFDPARDVNGNAIPAIFTTRITWSVE